MEIQIQLKPREKAINSKSVFFFHITEIDFGKSHLKLVHFEN